MTREPLLSLATEAESAGPERIDDDMIWSLRSALRFAASYSVITAAQEKAILSAICRAAAAEEG